MGFVSALCHYIYNVFLCKHESTGDKPPYGEVAGQATLEVHDSQKKVERAEEMFFPVEVLVPVHKESIIERSHNTCQ